MAHDDEQPGAVGSPGPQPVSARETVQQVVDEGLFEQVVGRIDVGGCT